MVGLSTTPASTASLLLNLEGMFTLGIAWMVFRENVDRRIALGAAAILAGACLAWGIDNNLTRQLSTADPLQIAILKGAAARTVNVILA
jgi:drug/metabolite transporter (DMT)-like permease